VDGLQAEHDKRRSPATYDRILNQVVGHNVTIHCTITRQQLRRPDYWSDFASFWSERNEVRNIWFSLLTPQAADQSEERLSPQDGQVALSELARVRSHFRKVYLPAAVLDGYNHPPASPQECIFAQATNCISADLLTRIMPVSVRWPTCCSEWQAQVGGIDSSFEDLWRF
jgi:hypothetical protein